MRLAFKYRFYPTPKQVIQLAKTFGHCRWVWNETLRFRTNAYHDRQERWGYNKLSRRLTLLKQEEGLGWLNDAPSVCLQQSLQNQQTALRNFFEKRCRYPRFKSRKGRQSASYVGTAFSLKGSTLKVAKLPGSLKIRWSRPIGGKVTAVTVSKDASDRYFVSFSVEAPGIVPLPRSSRGVGIDVGLTHFATLSDGEKIDNPRYHQRDLAKLKRAQQALSRKKKGSNNRRKSRLKVARIHARIADRRQDFLHKLSTRLVRENQTIAVEDLNIAGMVKNRRLARSISDAGWGEFTQMLEYKANWCGRDFVRIDRFFPSSKRCSECGFTLAKLPLNKRRWICPGCGREHDRDHNAAKNILAVGRTVTACGEGVSRHRVSR